MIFFYPDGILEVDDDFTGKDRKTGFRRIFQLDATLDRIMVFLATDDKEIKIELLFQYLNHFYRIEITNV